MAVLRSRGLWIWSVAPWCLAGLPATSLANRIFRPPTTLQALTPELCPTSCHDIFPRLKCDGDCEGGMQHQVEVQERGEPKSGTGFMFEWATGALGHACSFLVRAYGHGSCWMEWEFTNRTLIFEPDLAENDGTARCPCHDVKRVQVTILNGGKHTLPVRSDCEYSRRAGIALKDEKVCGPTVTRGRPSNQPELWDCVRSSNCQFVDDHLQMAVLRDPRPLAVSSYFHMLREYPAIVEGMSVDTYVVAMLPVFCQWVSVRYLVFAELLRDESIVFWYDEALEDPVFWHVGFFDFVGLRIPDKVLRRAANVASRGGSIFGFPSKGIDRHDGGAAAAPNRSFRDELNSTTLANMDDVLRVWLPTVMLEKVNVSSVSHTAFNEMPI